MSAPTLVTSGATAWNTTTTPKSSSSLSVQTGDVIVFYAVAEGNSISWGTPTGGSLTYTLQQNINLGSYCAINVWTAIATSTTSVTVSVTNSGSAIRWGVGWYVFRGSAGVGNSNKANNTTGTPSVSVTASGANSAMVAVNADWNAGATTGKTWATINAITPSAGNGLEKVATQDASHYTIYSAYWDDCGTTGAKSPGMTAPSGQQWAIIAVEILGSASSGATVTAAAITATSTVPDGTVATGSTIAPAAVLAMASVPDPVVSAGGATVTAAAITATATVPVGDVVTGSTVSPAAIAAATTVPSATVSGSEGATVTAAPITATASVPTPTLSGNVPPVDPDNPWVVRIAPGGDISDDPETLTWEDITARVRPGIGLRIGRTRAGEHADACQLTLRANNDDGELTPELVMAAWWPYIDLGLPMQLWRCNSAGTPALRATVAVDSITTEWYDGLDDMCDVVIVASGYLRWISQGQQVEATATTTTTVAAHPLAAWPLTDVAGATTGASALPGGTPMTRTSSGVVFGQITGPDGTTKYPSLVTSGRLAGTVPSTSVTDRWSVQVIALAESSSTDWWTVAHWTTTSASAPAWRIRWDGPTSGSTSLRWINGDGTETAVITVSGNPLTAWHRIAVYCVQSGGNVSCSMWIDGVLAGTGTATSVTTGRITTITVGDYDGPGNGFKSVGDVSVYDSELNASTQYQSQTGYDGEQAHERFLRLCEEAGIPASSDATVSVRMGPQKAQSLVEALRDCEDSDGGIIIDRTDRGLRYISTAEMYNQAAALTLDAATGHLQLGLSATRDDSTAATDVTITRDGGSSRRVVVPARRTYTDSDTLSLYTDELAGSMASWRAHHGAQTDLRINSVTWDAAKFLDAAGDPVLLDPTLALRVGQRIVVTGLPRPFPYEEVSLIVQGWTEIHDRDTFRMTAIVYPARLFEVATIGSDDPDDWDDTTWRIDSDTSTIGGSGGSTSSVSLVVESDYGWSTTDVPYDWNLLGERLRVTAMSAYVGGQQTATVTRSINGVSKAIPVGTQVVLWRPPVIGL